MGDKDSVKVHFLRIKPATHANNTMQAALTYAEKFGFSIIPIQSAIDPVKKEPLKKPFIKWEPYQTKKATVEEIRQWWGKWPGAMIGIVTGQISGVLVIDCDTREGYEAIQKLLPDALLLPMARTPRGGWHLWFLYPQGSKITIGTGLMPGVDFRGEGGYVIAPPSVNDEGKAYQWEIRLDDTELATVPESLYKYISLYAHRGGCQRQQKPLRDNIDNIFEQGKRDENLFHIGYCLARTGNSEDYIRQTLTAITLSWGETDEAWINTKVQSAFKRIASHERNITADIREWVLTTAGNFLTTDVYKEQHLTTREEMKVANVVLRRLCEGENPILEKHGDRRGCYRLIDRSIEFMNFADADIENTVDLRLPLGVHSKTKLFPKSVIVIAGVSGMGKTLFAFNTIAENMDRFPTFYFNSEMGPEQLKQKLSHFPIPMDKWEKGMKVVKEWDFNNIADKVFPDAFNVIDYLEPEGDRPYNIHGVISAIIRRLNKGTALICIQKKPGATMGTGGIYSIKAATLALALDWGKIVIVKNRFREADMQPRLNKINFEVHQGYKFVKVGNWY